MTDFKMKKVFSRKMLCAIGSGALFFACMQTVTANENQRWVKFTDASFNDEVLYMDSQSVVTPDQQPNWRLVKVLVQEKEAAKKSRVVSLMLDCEKARARNDGGDEYNRPWAKGKVVAHEDGDGKDEFREFEFDSDNADDKAVIDLYRKVCNK